MADADTRLKRASATSLIVPSMAPGLVTDGTIAAADRQAVTWMYSGILAEAPVPITDKEVLHTPQNYIDWFVDKQPKRIPVVF